MKNTILIFTVLITFSTSAMIAKAHNSKTYTMEKVSYHEAKSHLNAFREVITIPSDYYFKSVKRIKADNTPAFLFRFEKPENNDTEEHFSFVISEKDKQILGFTIMDQKYSNSKIVSKKDAEKTAKDFLLKLDNSLAGELKNLWIERHDEKVTINKTETIVSGMKYKCYNASRQDYVWVIVGFDNSVITFERNIKWDNNKHERITEKWLHDNWIKVNVLDSNSEKEILKKMVEETFANGALNKLDTKEMARGFHPDFAIVIAKENDLFRLPLKTWIKVVEDYKNSPDKRNSGIRNLEYTIEILDITKNIASVKIEFYRDQKLIITDYLSYIKYPDGWKAVAKISNEHITNPLQLNL
ncbi:nuclear transport factor 2 family protein [Flavobacterium nitrogenifigens]|uniref:Lumazine-binding n=1 Tax=Flavobacterium nitrogenifigens TaxID=1617283 RepID=A0A521B7G1_9FLAO|nr:nuclear transport factor 2 family protein [Flavobacterium nitrogenifigens]KAF2334536.1 hypothetical protein DM397_07640 [Flavobacterium nitrogenifigens]SMO42941.1 Putative lumazine-binding [Flavobacterium nitrogenifigens]